MKQQGTAYEKPPEYADIHMPRNSPAGFVIGVFAFLFGFAMIWHIWWLAIASAVGMLATVVARSLNDDIEYVIPAAEVERTENERRRLMAQAATQSPADTGADVIPQPLPQV
jgi:cytochrome o ubiquinol oxidase subunit 1